MIDTLSKVKTTLVPEEDVYVWDDDVGDFVESFPSNYFIILADGSRWFVHTRDRGVARQVVEQEWGKKYSLRTAKMSSNRENLTAR